MPDRKASFRVQVNDFTFTFDQQEIDTCDFIRLSPTTFNLIREFRSVNATLLESDPTAKNLAIEIDGETFQVTIKDELDQKLDNMGYSNLSTKHVKEIKAPMPGLVVSVSVQEGQEVKEGERVLILEAMKMENSILLHADGRIRKVNVAAGQAVDKGQVLVELE
jgi:biotin carboxyl carrier protein